MSNNNLSQVLQQGVRIAVGAAASLLETAQNPEKRAEAVSEWQMELSQKTREWAIKGETTEQEAKRILDRLLYQVNSVQSDRSKEANSFSPDDKDNICFALQQLKNDLVALRIELARMRDAQK